MHKYTYTSGRNPTWQWFSSTGTLGPGLQTHLNSPKSEATGLPPKEVSHVLYVSLIPNKKFAKVPEYSSNNKYQPQTTPDIPTPTLFPP